MTSPEGGSLDYLYPRRSYQWMDDADSPTCLGCDRPFTLLRRRHHCRLCGGLFCDPCSRARRDLPLLLRGRVPGGALAPTTGVRTCRACTSHLDSNRGAHAWSERLRINAFCTVREWRALAQAGSETRRAAQMLLTAWRRTAYALPWERPTDDEARFLAANRHLLAGHGRLCTLALLVGVQVPAGARQRQRPRASCASLGCYPHCTRAMRAGDAVELLSRLGPEHVEARALALDGLLAHVGTGSRASTRLRPFLASLLRLAAADPAVRDVVLCKLVQDPATAHLVVWRAWGLGLGDVADRLLDVVPRPVRAEIEASRRWADRLEAVLDADPACRGGPDDELVGSAHFPGERQMFVVRVLTSQMHTIQDASSRPTLVPLVVVADPGGTQIVQHVLYKRADLSRDTAAMDVTDLLTYVLTVELGDPVPHVRYPVVQLRGGGLVVIAEGSRSLASIQRVERMSLLNFLIDNNPTVRSGTLRTTFVRSVAFSSVLCLLLGVGDRHLDNIMVKVTTPYGGGVLFHIDFEFMLGSEPVHLQGRQRGIPRLRITSSVEDALGGSRSHDFATFRRQCGAYMGVAQRYAREIFYVLEGHGCGSRDAIVAHLRSWIRPGDDDEGYMQLRIDQVVRQSSRYRTLDSIMDHVRGATQSVRETTRSWWDVATGGGGGWEWEWEW